MDEPIIRETQKPGRRDGTALCPGCGNWKPFTAGVFDQHARPKTGVVLLTGDQTDIFDQEPCEGSGLDVRVCRVCGCDDGDCGECIQATGVPCHWVEDDLCSRCVGQIAQAVPAESELVFVGVDPGVDNGTFVADLEGRVVHHFTPDLALDEAAVAAAIANAVKPIPLLAPVPTGAWAVCPNCEQWQRPPNGDCMNECAKRGFATYAVKPEMYLKSLDPVWNAEAYEALKRDLSKPVLVGAGDVSMGCMVPRREAPNLICIHGGKVETVPDFASGELVSISLVDADAAAPGTLFGALVCPKCGSKQVSISGKITPTSHTQSRLCRSCGWKDETDG